MGPKGQTSCSVPLPFRVPLAGHHAPALVPSVSVREEESKPDLTVFSPGLHVIIRYKEGILVHIGKTWPRQTQRTPRHVLATWLTAMKHAVAGGQC